MNKEQTQEKQKLKLPRFCYVFYGIFAFFVVIYITAINYTPFADFYNRYVSSVFRGTLATITNILPLSLAELIVITMPITLFFLINFARKKYCESWHDVGIFLLTALSLVGIFFSLFITAFGIGYYTTTLDKKLGLDKQNVSAKELAATAEWLIAEMNREIDNVDFEDKSSSISPYDTREMNLLLLDAYDKISEKYEFIPRLKSYIKPIMLSKPMTYTHISGVYTFFTGEANINTNAPDYCIPFTAAHELAHQRGIAREDEANFVAFLVCTTSDDPYIRYCGYLNLFEYVRGALYTANAELGKEIDKKLDHRAAYEINAFNKFYEKYQDNVVGEISGAINDAYLQANGTPGERSYGLVVDLAVAYFHANIEN